jgi:hypothetical protein
MICNSIISPSQVPCDYRKCGTIIIFYEKTRIFYEKSRKICRTSSKNIIKNEISLNFNNYWKLTMYKTYIWQGVCDHYDQKLHRDIKDRTSIYINCTDKNILQDIVRELPGDDIILTQDYELDIWDGDNSYFCEVYVKDIDKENCLKYLEDNDYKAI